MSIFFGIFRPQGGPVDPEAFEDMRKASEREGFDSMRVHVEDKIAVGHLMLRVSPEDEYDQQPLKSSCGRYLLVGHFRLDYRDELGDKIGLTQSELQNISDSKLVMMAYQKWGEQCVHHIEGDWAFVLFEMDLNKLFLAKDKTGISSLFYITHKDSILFSSDIKPIVQIQKLELGFDFSQVIRMSVPGLEIQKAHTVYRDLKYLESSYYLVIDKSLTHQVTNYWNFPNRVEIKFSFDLDYALQMHSIFLNAVKSRIRTNSEVGIFLSSGLDSTAVAYQAANELMFQKRNLFSFTSLPMERNMFSQSDLRRSFEEPGVKDFVFHNTNVIPEFSDFSDIKFSEYLKERGSLGLFSPIVSPNEIWLSGFLSKSKSKGIKLFLNGQLGNYTLSWNSSNIDYYALCTFNIKRLLKALIWNHKKNGGAFNFLKQKLISPLRVHIAKKVKFFFLSYSQFIFKSSILKEDFKTAFLRKDTFEKNEYIPWITSHINPRLIRKGILQKYMNKVGMNWILLSNEYAVVSCDPTSDARLINYSFSINEELFNKNAITKYIYKLMYSKKNPDSIVFNTQSFIQSADLNLRLAYDECFINQSISFLKDDLIRSYVNVSQFEVRLNTLNHSGSVNQKRDLGFFLLKNYSLLTFLSNNKPIFMKISKEPNEFNINRMGKTRTSDS